MSNKQKNPCPSEQLKLNLVFVVSFYDGLFRSGVPNEHIKNLIVTHLNGLEERLTNHQLPEDVREQYQQAQLQLQDYLYEKNLVIF